MDSKETTMKSCLESIGMHQKCVEIHRSSSASNEIHRNPTNCIGNMIEFHRKSDGVHQNPRLSKGIHRNNMNSISNLMKSETESNGIHRDPINSIGNPMLSSGVQWISRGNSKGIQWNSKGHTSNSSRNSLDADVVKESPMETIEIHWNPWECN